MIATVPVTCKANDQQGNPVSGAIYTFKLNHMDLGQDEVIAPEMFRGVADENGLLNQNLWPNALGTRQSYYRVKAINPDTGAKFFDEYVFVPNIACALKDITVPCEFPSVSDSEIAYQELQALVAAARHYWNLFQGAFYGPLDADPVLDPLGFPVEAGDLYYHTDLHTVMVYNGTHWIAFTASGSGGGVGAGGQTYMFENEAQFPLSYQITTGRNAMSAGPITLLDGSTIVVPGTSVWTIV